MTELTAFDTAEVEFAKWRADNPNGDEVTLADFRHAIEDRREDLRRSGRDEIVAQAQRITVLSLPEGKRYPVISAQLREWEAANGEVYLERFAGFAEAVDMLGRRGLTGERFSLTDGNLGTMCALLLQGGAAERVLG